MARVQREPHILFVYVFENYRSHICKLNSEVIYPLWHKYWKDLETQVWVQNLGYLRVMGRSCGLKWRVAVITS